jgi:hypothetical protein
LGGLDYLLKVHLLENVAASFELSYGPDASPPVRVVDKDWGPTIKLITAYTRASLPKDKQPRVIARFTAVAAAQEQVGNGQIAQWTAPSTPIAVIYKDWTGSEPLSPEDCKIVGTIGDFRSWISQYRDKWQFRLNRLLLAFLGLVTAMLSLRARIEPRNGTTGREATSLALC